MKFNFEETQYKPQAVKKFRIGGGYVNVNIEQDIGIQSVEFGMGLSSKTKPNPSVELKKEEKINP